MAGLAADADLRERCGKAIGRRIVVLAHAGRMTFGAHEVPVLVQLGPVQDVVVTDLLVRIEVEPALAALCLRSAVPGHRQGLQAAVGKLDQVLLQRIDAEGVFDLESGKLAIGSVGFDQKFAVVAKEARAHTVVVEGRAGKIAEHGRLGRMIHRMPVLRATPQLGLLLVAAGAGRAADEAGRGGIAGQPKRRGRVPRVCQHLQTQAGDHHQAGAKGYGKQDLPLEKPRAPGRGRSPAPSVALRDPRLFPDVLWERATIALCSGSKSQYQDGLSAGTSTS